MGSRLEVEPEKGEDRFRMDGAGSGDVPGGKWVPTETSASNRHGLRGHWSPLATDSSMLIHPGKGKKIK